MKALAQKIKCKTFTLSNGLTVWLNEDHHQPKVFGAVVVKAGAKDCPNTGIAHYFEHIMFKGTDKIGTVDYESEKVYLDKIAEKYDELAVATDEQQRAQIQQEINKLSVKAADFVIPNEFDRLISKYGGTKLNAETSIDFTSYYNVFSPQYLMQWLEINSERFLNPVFRMFQSELETVYEEKNMYGDYIGGLSMERLKERYFKDHPYAYPIIGSTENLKNPRLSEMRRFFEKYYVGPNMGLILCGDFKTEQALPMIEKAFSRIPKGEPISRITYPLPEFKGRETFFLKVPVPFVKIMVLGFRGVPANHPDEVALKIISSLLNNSNGTGFLDRLVVDHKVLAATVINEQMNDAGILAIVVMPRMLFQSYSSAEKKVWNEIEKLKKGEFSDEFFQSLKLEQKRNYTSALEDISSRARVMMNIFSQGKTWNEYLCEIERIDALTKEDIVNAACRYFTEDYLHVLKKTGQYPKDDLSKPDYAPIVPKHQNESSDYAKELEKLPVEQLSPHFITAETCGMQIKDLTPYVKLYVTENPVNEIFSLDLLFSIGSISEPRLKLMANYLQHLGTTELSFAEFRSRLQSLGSIMTFEANERSFVVRITGFDNNFSETLLLVSSFLKQAKPNDKKLRHLVDEIRVVDKSFKQSADSMARALMEKMIYGEKSIYLTKPSVSEVKKMKGEDLVSLLHNVMTYACDIHYCGNRSREEVEELLLRHLPLGDVVNKSISPCLRKLKSYKKPQVFFYDKSDISQSIIGSFVCGETLPEQRERFIANMFTEYFGGNMNSVLFQEIREFRSLAYRVSGRFQLPSRQHIEQPGFMLGFLSTQCDKTIDAMSVLQALIDDMPLYPDKLDDIKQSIRNEVNSMFPSFRDVSLRWAFYNKEGFEEDPNKLMLEAVDSFSLSDIFNFYKRHLKGRPVNYAIVGNRKKIDMEKLSSFGEIVYMKDKDVFK